MKHGIMVPVVLALLAATVAEARAGYVVYADRAAFQAATYNPQVIDFEGLADSFGLAWYLDGAGLVQKGVRFTAPTPDGDWLFVIESWFDPTFYDWGSGAV